MDARVCPIDGTSLEDAPDPLVGRTIGGRYLVCELVGSGGMGTVYRGRHQLVGRDVALKFLAPRFARDAAARERFLREARAANRIDHEHIIDITDFGETSDNLVFLVMEYLDGELLSKLIEEGPIEPKRALNIAWQLATALARAHELDVIHRDIKPDNIFVLQRRGGDFVKLLDFGLAKVTGEHRLTASGKVFGTPEYLSPEQARGEHLTGAADQYALGCVLYEMLVGALPFEGQNSEVVLRHLQVTPIKPSARNPALATASEIDALVMRMLEKVPTDRFSDSFHLADELHSILDRLQSGGRSSKAPRRSGVHHPVTPAEPSAATQPWVDAAEETWAQRLALYQNLIPRAFGSAGAPPEVHHALSEVERLVLQAKHLRLQLGSNVLRAKENEDSLRGARLRLGHAIDELGQDESRVVRRSVEARAAVEDAEQRLVELADPLLTLWRALPRPPDDELSHPVAELFRQAGGAAQLWLEADAQAGAIRARLLAAEREREDLRFQIAQLKGRLGIMSAEGEAELGGLRDQADGLEAELVRAIESLARAADPVIRALNAIPGMAEQLTFDVRGVAAASVVPR